VGLIMDIYIYIYIYRWILLRMRNVSDKCGGWNQNTSFKFNNSFRKSCCLWNIVEKYGTVRQATDDNIIWRMRFTCWIIKATDTHSEYVIYIAVACSPRLHYTYNACLVTYNLNHYNSWKFW
jgi:hypothetical protein